MVKQPEEVPEPPILYMMSCRMLPLCSDFSQLLHSHKEKQCRDVHKVDPSLFCISTDRGGLSSVFVLQGKSGVDLVY